MGESLAASPPPSAGGEVDALLMELGQASKRVILPSGVTFCDTNSATWRAANTIASLQSEVEMAHELVGQKSEQYIAARKEADKLQSEVERLRTALQGLMRATDHWSDWEPGAKERDIARKALETVG